MLSLQERGVLKELKIKWWEKERGGGSCKLGAASSSAQLGLANLGGVFIVLLGGMLISIIVAIFEFAWKRRKLAVDENVSEFIKIFVIKKYCLGVSPARDVGGLQVRGGLAGGGHQAHQAGLLRQQTGLQIHPLQVRSLLPQQGD